MEWAAGDNAERRSVAAKVWRGSEDHRTGAAVRWRTGHGRGSAAGIVRFCNGVRGGKPHRHFSAVSAVAGDEPLGEHAVDRGAIEAGRERAKRTGRSDAAGGTRPADAQRSQ